MTISERKLAFHKDVLLSNAIRDSLARGHTVYKEGQPREEFQEALKSELRRLAQKYSGKDVQHESHITNIRDLASGLTKDYASVLFGTFTFGRAAKALNVYLKHLWCEPKPPLAWITKWTCRDWYLDIRPTHCPFDRGLIDDLSPQKQFKRDWTDGGETDYREWVRLAFEKAAEQGYSKLAEWELVNWKPSD